MAPVLFTNCSGIGSVSEVLEVRDGNTGITTKTPGPTRFTNIVCTRPISADNSLIDWRVAVESGDANFRKSILILLLDGKLQTVKSWKVQRGWPVKWQLSELDAAKNEVSTETLEIAHEGLRAQ